MTGEPTTGAAEIGWGRAAISAVAILVVGFLGAVMVPSWLLSGLGGMTTTGRGVIAGAVCVIVVIVMAVVLRRLQARRLI
jgi:hypothetical protein